MAETKKTFHKRPTFSAPTPPAKKAHDLVSNDKEEVEPVIDEVVEETTPETEEVVTTPAPKMVSRSRPSAAESALDSVLSETSQEEDERSDPQPQERTLTTARIRKNETREGAPPMNFLLVVITLFSLIFGVSGWAMYFKQAGALDLPMTEQNAQTTPTPGTEAMVEASPTPEPVVVNLEVLNGSGVSGVAASTATKLQGLGYTVVRTGNADNQNYDTTQILLNEDFAGADDLLAKLEDEFGSAEKSDEALTGSTASARIIVGKDWAD